MRRGMGRMDGQTWIGRRWARVRSPGRERLRLMEMEALAGLRIGRRKQWASAAWEPRRHGREAAPRAHDDTIQG
jgi:hypothetical protein